MDIRKIGFILALIGFGAIAAQSYDMITIQQMVAINLATMLTMMTMVTVLLYRIIKSVKISNSYVSSDIKVIIPRAHIDDTLISANSDIFKKNIIPTNPFHGCIFRISMELKDPIEKLNMFVIRLRDSNITEDNINGASAEEGIYVINTVVRPDEALNFKFDRDIDIKNFMIDELYIP